MRYSIKGHVYDMPRNQYQATIKMLKQKLKGKNVIIALEQGESAEARNDQYPTRKDLLEAVREWRKAGFIVVYNLGK
nr:MAG TPA: hypothetical protein [Caudoviricetes sp.]